MWSFGPLFWPFCVFVCFWYIDIDTNSDNWSWEDMVESQGWAGVGYKPTTNPHGICRDRTQTHWNYDLRILKFLGSRNFKPAIRVPFSRKFSDFFYGFSSKPKWCPFHCKPCKVVLHMKFSIWIFAFVEFQHLGLGVSWNFDSVKSRFLKLFVDSRTPWNSKVGFLLLWNTGCESWILVKSCLQKTLIGGELVFDWVTVMFFHLWWVQQVGTVLHRKWTYWNLNRVWKEEVLCYGLWGYYWFWFWWRALLRLFLLLALIMKVSFSLGFIIFFWWSFFFMLNYIFKEITGRLKQCSYRQL